MERYRARAAGILLAVGLLPLQAGASSCPSYFNKLDPIKCNADGFCGWFDLRADRLHDGVLEQDNPPPEAATLPGPWTDSRNATVGSADWFAIVDAEFDAGRSRVTARADSHVEAPLDFPTFDSFGEGSSIAVARVTDLVFTGPTADVETSLHLVFGGTLSELAVNLMSEVSSSTMIAQTNIYLGGGICRGFSDYVDFLGYHIRSLIDDGEGDARLDSSDFFLLDQVPLEGQTELVVGPFTVPTGEALQLEFWIETTLTTSGRGGIARAAADFSLALGPIGGGLVFDLPAGYTANSPTAQIVANTVPEPGALAGLATAGALAALARRKR